MHPELCQPGKNLLQKTCCLIGRLQHFPLKINQTAIDKCYHHQINSPDCQCLQGKLPAIPQHQPYAPKGKDKVENLPHKLPCSHGFDCLNTIHALQKLTCFKPPEKFCRQLQKPAPESSFHRHIKMIGNAQHRNRAHHGKS